VRFDPGATIVILERNLALLLLAIYLAGATIRRRDAGAPAGGNEVVPATGS
jgi:hypothetical protein